MRLSCFGALLRHAIKIIEDICMHVVFMSAKRVSYYYQVSLCLSLASRVIVGVWSKINKGSLLQRFWSNTRAAACRKIMVIMTRSRELDNVEMIDVDAERMQGCGGWWVAKKKDDKKTTTKS